MIGIIIEAWVTCDGEEILGAAWPHDGCQLVGQERTRDVGGARSSPRHSALSACVAETARMSGKAGWTVVDDGALKRHLCPLCTAVRVRMGARHDSSEPLRDVLRRANATLDVIAAREPELDAEVQSIRGAVQILALAVGGAHERE